MRGFPRHGEDLMDKHPAEAAGRAPSAPPGRRPGAGKALRGLLRGLLLGLLVVADATAQSGLRGAELIAALRDGGYNLYFRHAATDWSNHDRVRRDGDWTSCDGAVMRQLSDSGRETARAIGAAIQALNIPVGEVLASPYCRTMETARLMGLGAVQPSTDVINMRVADQFGGRQAVIATARRLLATPPPDGTNRVIVAHGNVARDATPVYPDEAEAVIFRPDGQGGSEVVGRLLPAQWSAPAGR
jgi:hypothetical protein